MEYITEDDVLNLGPIDFMIKVRDFLAENAKDSIFEEEKKGIKNLLLELFSLSDKELIKDIRENIAERVNKMLAQKKLAKNPTKAGFFYFNLSFCDD